MSELAKLIEHFLLGHQTMDVMLLGVVGTAFSSTFPDKRPRTLDEWWEWARDFVHQLGNAKRPTIQKP